ncbi:hypothetical protein [Sinorhizobium sp. NFACC03]|uniref:hypothetical protein n=1 Tax=Sinorhizobium sp. NFACC03 TaxID=1566295 RepID=UPI00115FE353|nr:hypothetical protein [Sinorhizobium sp. NFACC03]
MTRGGAIGGEQRQNERTIAGVARDPLHRIARHMEFPDDLLHRPALHMEGPSNTLNRIRSADPNSARNFELVVARCGRDGRGEPGGRYFVTSTGRTVIRDCALHALRREGYSRFDDVTVISDGAEILKRLPRAMPKPTAHITDWSTSP